jgi:hypothetical protein
MNGGRGLDQVGSQEMDCCETNGVVPKEGWFLTSQKLE